MAELAVLNDIATAINSSHNVDRILELITQRCKKNLGVEQSAVMLLEKKEADDVFRTRMRDMDSSHGLAPVRFDDQLTGWMLRHQQPLLVNDFRKDSRFSEFAGEDSLIRSLLSVPLTAKGKMIGVLTVFNKKTDEGFNTDDQRLLTIIAAQSAQVIENARLVEEEQALIRMREELNLAHRIQTNLLPKETPQVPGYEVYGRSLPAKVVGGDYFDFIPVTENRLAFCLADVAGKGIPAALIMSNLQATIRAQSHDQVSVVDCLRRTNFQLFHSTTPEKFATMLYGCLDYDNHRLHYANAGHNFPYFIPAGEAAYQLEGGGLVLGVMEENNLKEYTLNFRPGDLLLVYSDGISEAMNDLNEEFGEERMTRVAAACRGRTVKEMAVAILEEVWMHAGECSQSDDMTLLIIRRRE